MELKSYTVGPFSENTYLLTKGSQSILIDPGFFDPTEYKQFKQDFDEIGSQLAAIILTHAHVDHILGLEKVLRDFDVPVYLNHSDLYLWENFPNQAAMFGFRTGGFDFIPEPLEEQLQLSIGGMTFDVLYTPGHSPDHVSLYFKDENLLIAGDVLFNQSVGRTDLYKGDFDTLATSIRQKLYTLPDDTNVWPGHGPSTTIGFEKLNNGFVKG
ncbi:MAG: MBL fold metallo-hydrolase [Balneolaceae bacterium]